MPTWGPKAMLVVNELYAGYGGPPVLKGVSFTVERGKIVSLIGANGAGKTTTLRTIMGTITPTSGSIEFEGKPIGGLTPPEIVSLGISLIPEGRRIFPRLTVMENLRMGAYLRWEPNKIRVGMEEVLELFPALKDRLKQRGGTLSGGEQQMLAIARGLMSKPRLLVLDEPSMGLAPILREVLFNIIREINSKGTTVFLVEQNAQMALALSDFGYVMETGRIVLKDTAQNLLRNEEVKRAYLGG